MLLGVGIEIPDYPISNSRRHLRVQVARWRENLIDLETVVDDTRHALERAVRERNEAALHLAHLVERYTHLTSVADGVPWTTEHISIAVIVRQ